MWEENLRAQLRSRYAPRRRRRQDSGSSKASKRARKTPIPADDYADPDRISSLPDTVLRHILSFLDTKYAVVTSVLSTRWKDLCISLPNIVLDDSLTFKKRKKNFEKAFEKFACRQILLRNVPNINRFRLKSNFIEDSTIGDIVCAAICCKVKEIDLWVGDSTTVGILPLELFICNSLVVLKLRAVVELYVWESVSLPNLKVLHLTDFMLDGDRSMSRLFRGCKFVEELCLSRCSFGNNKVLNLSFPLLRKLSIDYGDGNFMDFFDDSNSKCKLIIDTPNLEFFEYHGHENEFHLVKNLNSLVRAKISFITKVKNWENVSELFNKMHGVKSLYLSDSALEVMYSNCSSLSVFEALTFLELSVFDIRILPNVLEIAPQLKEIVIHK
ncbi:F-box At4g22280-like, partial [Olea europaea subsp. europaea]